MNPPPPTTPPCFRCRKQPRRAGRTRCLECAAFESVHARAAFLQKLTTCAGCLAAPALGRRRCPVHSAGDTASLRGRRLKHRAEGRCFRCKLPARVGKTTCAAHAGNQYGRRRSGRV
jgi:hypothetical protein